MLLPFCTRHITTSVRYKNSLILLECRIKPGVNPDRHGILLVSDSHIVIGISAQPRNGEANNSLINILSNTLKCPRSNIEITRGHKYRIKTVAIDCINIGDTEKSPVACVRELLEAASRSASS